MHEESYRREKITCICGCRPVAVLRLDSTVRLAWCKANSCAERFGVIVEDRCPGARDQVMRELAMKQTRYRQRSMHYKPRSKKDVA